MLTVIAIIVVLAGILLPALARMGERAKIAATSAQIAAIGNACHTYEADFGFYPPDTLKDNDNGHASVDKPAEALWFFLAHQFTYKPTTEFNFQEQHASKTADFSKPTVFGTRTAGAYIPVTSSQVKDIDGDGVPELVDMWKQPYLYNTAGGQFGTPRHNPLTFDIFSVGPNGRTRQANSDYDFQKVRSGSVTYANWLTWVMDAAAPATSCGGNDTAGEGANAVAGSYKEDDRDDINNWNTR